jgi:hypothetical protein
MPLVDALPCPALTLLLLFLSASLSCMRVAWVRVSSSVLAPACLLVCWRLISGSRVGDVKLRQLVLVRSRDNKVCAYSFRQFLRLVILCASGRFVQRKLPTANSQKLSDDAMRFVASVVKAQAVSTVEDLACFSIVLDDCVSADTFMNKLAEVGCCNRFPALCHLSNLPASYRKALITFRRSMVNGNL